MNIKKLKKYIIILAIAIILVLTILIIYVNATKEKVKTPESIFKQPEGVHLESIKYTKYNEVTYAYISDQQICNIYLMDYRSKMINHPEQAYYNLDEEYRNLRFGSLENFKKYIKENEKNIFNMKLSKYKTNKDNKQNRYICIDQYNNYYIFNETAVMKYSVILDTYTVDIPEYLEKYNKSTNQEKVALCIDKFIQNINAKNYALAYSMLSNGFKNNYFKTLSSFENYAKQNFLGKSITYKTVENQADIYIYEVTLTKQGVNLNDKNFNVKLGEGTKFELSFNMQ